MLKLPAVFLWRAAILLLKGSVKIFGIGKTGSHADIQQRLFGEKQELPGLFTAYPGQILLKGETEVFLKEMRKIVQVQP